ncbi:MAG TPA: MFS transporter [Rhizomicrobium sp.]|jgi:MFS family permease|nr:MFS transporter [Rhizomicrobium sp.]
MLRGRHGLDDIYASAESAEERELAYEAFVARNLPRNYAGHFTHGTLGMTGFRLVNAPTFVPAYLHMLSGSDVLTGLGLALQQFGSTISPIAGATAIEHRKHVLPVTMILGTLMRVQILFLALAGWLLSGQSLLVASMVFLFLLGLFSGWQGVAFQYLLAKVIPISKRGRLQGWRNMAGGLIAALLSYFAGRYFVGPNLWGNGYGVTFLTAFVLTSMGLLAIRILLREPELPTLRPRMRTMERLREFPSLLRAERGFREFMIARTFAISGRMASPFYIVFAAHTISLSGQTIGALSFAYLIADTVTNLGWGHLADKTGFRSSFVGALIIWIAATALLMSVHTLPLFFIAFFGLGAANSGYTMSAQNIVFEFGHRDEMAMRLALSNTAESAMAALGPLVGGLIAAAAGYYAVFGVSMLFLAIGLTLMLTRVEEPRKRRAAG